MTLITYMLERSLLWSCHTRNESLNAERGHFILANHKENEFEIILLLLTSQILFLTMTFHTILKLSLLLNGLMLRTLHTDIILTRNFLVSSTYIDIQKQDCEIFL